MGEKISNLAEKHRIDLAKELRGFNIHGELQECVDRIRAVSEMFFCKLINEWREFGLRECNGITFILKDIADKIDKINDQYYEMLQQAESNLKSESGGSIIRHLETSRDSVEVQDDE